MTSAIVQTSKPVTLVGGGDVHPDDVANALQLAPVLVAADGGADAVLALGHTPDAVIGDFDSISAQARETIPKTRQHRIAEQDSTDFDKALRNIDAPLVLAVGFLGARLDHQLAALNTLSRRAAPPCIMIGTEDIVFRASRQLKLDLKPADTVSLFPMRPVTGTSTGLEWPIDGLELAPGGRVGTSNRALGPVTLRFDTPGMLVILPKVHLNIAIDALQIGASVGL